MKIIVREEAAADLDAAIAWIGKNSPCAAANFRNQIVQRINNLAVSGLSHIGRIGQIAGTRELIVPPYIVVYEVDASAGEITVLAIMHAAQNRDRPV